MPQRLPRLTRHQTDPINRLLADHVEHTLGKRLRLSRYVLGDELPAAPQRAEAPSATP
jgi:hypothetical protein